MRLLLPGVLMILLPVTPAPAEGLLVDGTFPESPAERAGVRTGDRILLETDPGTAFRPVSFDIRRSIRFNHPKEDVCPLFEPEWRRLWIPWWKPEVLYSPPGKTREGTVLRVPSPRGDGAAILTYVSRHDPGAMEIRYSILYRDVEIEKMQITCDTDPNGGTVAEIRTVILGLNDYGNRAVRQHVEAGNVEKGIEEYRRAIVEYLDEKNPGR